MKSTLIHLGFPGLGCQCKSSDSRGNPAALLAQRGFAAAGAGTLGDAGAEPVASDGDVGEGAKVLRWVEHAAGWPGQLVVGAAIAARGV